jgi:O-antigen/teichoic acid export membrane protein
VNSPKQSGRPDAPEDLEATATTGAPFLDAVAVLDSPTAGGKVIRGSVFRIGGYVAGVLLGVLAASLMIRHLGVVDWGQYVTVFSLVAIVSGLSDAGLTAIGAREYVTREGEERDRLMRNLLGLRLAITAVGIAAAVVFAVVAGYGSVLVVGTVVAGLALLASVAQQMYMVPLGSALKIGWVSGLDLARQVLTVAFVVVLVAAGAGLLPFLAVPLPVTVAVLVLTIVLVRGSFPFAPSFDRDAWRHVLELTLVYSAAAAAASFYTSLTVVIASLLATSEELGYYGASFRIFSVLTALPLLAVNLAFPIVARAALNDEERFKYVMQRLFEAAIIFGTWMALATVLGARFAIDVIAGPRFHPAIPVLQIQGAALLGTFLTVTWGTGLLALHRHRALLLTNLLGLVTIAAVTVALVPPLGEKGPAIATLVGESVLAIAYSIALLGSDRRLRVKVGVIPKVAVAAAAAASVALVPGLDGLLLVLAATGVFFAVLWIVRGVPSELHEAFLQSRAGGSP